MQLPTHMLVDAAKAQCQADGVPFMVRQKGDPDRGTIFVCLSNLAGEARLYHQERNLDFELEWQKTPSTGLLTESEAEERIAKAIAFDPDQWVIEIEDKAMNFPFL